MQNTDSRKQKKSASESFSDKELQDAGQLVNIFMLAWKNYGLYPEEHTASQKAIQNLASTFDKFFNTHGDLRLTVEKDRLLYGSDLLHEVSSDTTTEDIISLLYRDGIKWFEFQHGLTIDELTCFFKTAFKYRMLEEETEGDIVTALMDADLEHINLKAVDTFWQDFPLIDFSQLDTSLPETEETAYQIEKEESQKPEGSVRMDSYAKSIADSSVSDALWEISAAEHEKLQQMVLDEENWDNAEDIFDVMLVILQSQTDRENFAAVLDFTSEEVVETIEQEEFGLLLDLFQSLHKLLPKEASVDHAWIRPLIDRFFQNLSKPGVFDLITDKLLKLHDNDTEKLKVLRQVLLYFSPVVIISLGPVITQSRSHKVQKMVLEVIEYLCHRDIGPLEKILEHHDHDLTEKLLPILSRLQGDRVNIIFFKLIKHPSEKVRIEAFRELVSRDPHFAHKLFSLINDPSEKIRTGVLAAISKQRSTVLENMLLKYLRENSAQQDPAHILACYEALGRCGSNNSIPFLSRILLEKGWNRFKGLGKLIHREGAAVALALLDTWEAKDILLAASKSKFKVIREAFQRAMARSDVSGENAND